MAGGTTFHFVTDDIHVALQAAAGGRNVRIGGGGATIRQYLRAELIDELHIAISPVMLGAGENLLAERHAPKLGLHKATPNASDVVLTQRGP